MKLLTKSKYMTGLDCLRLLWMKVNEPEKIPKPTPADQLKFDQGTLVGELATKLYKNGIDLANMGFEENISKTQELLKERIPIFEAGFVVDNLFSRVDILNPIEKDAWDIIEVKSSTRTKDQHISDVAFQKYCCELAGLTIRNCFIMHVDNTFVKEGDIDPKEFFVLENVSDRVELNEIPGRIALMFDVINAKTPPDFDLSAIEKSKYGSFLIDEFISGLPEGNIFELYNARKKKLVELFKDDIKLLSDLPDDFKLTDKQKIQVSCFQSGKPHVDADGIKKFLSTLKKPLYFLDFETYSTAIPLYDGCKPYQQIPFQFSLHVEKDGKIDHYEYLSNEEGNPIPQFAAELKKVLGTKGSIIVYNKSFENARIKEIGALLPEYKEWADEVLTRIVDLKDIFSKFAYYHPKQKGSASLKKVLPVLTGKGYGDMDIADGNTASVEFMKIMGLYGERPNEDEIKRIRKALLEYCKLDTWAEVLILRGMYEL